MGGRGGGGLPGHRGVVEHEDALGAQQGGQAPGHHVVQHDAAEGQADGPQLRGRPGTSGHGNPRGEAGAAHTASAPARGGLILPRSFC